MEAGDVGTGIVREPPARHPVRVVVADDLQRSRLTVFFRLLLAIPHFIWLSLWGSVVFLAVLFSWFATLFTGRTPDGLHSILAAYVRYTTHVSAYLLLAANPFPGFLGKAGSYPVDVEIDPPAPQNRWTVGFRLVLAVPALIVAGSLIGYGAAGSRTSFNVGVVATVSLFAWFVCLVRGRLPQGFRRSLTYGLGYAAQLDAYVLLLTDRYPNSDPTVHVRADPEAPNPIRLAVEEDERRSRLTVFFRLLLAIPHLLWLTLWGVVTILAAIVSWFATLFTGRSPGWLHRFLSAYLRYATHVQAFLFMVANPFPGFAGKAGSYPVDVEIGEPARQNRWITGFRLVLAVPALILQSAFGTALFAVAFLGWWASLFTGQMPRGLNRLGAYSIRYTAQAYGYLYLLTDRYPYTGPVASDFGEQAAAPPEPPAAEGAPESPLQRWEPPV